ncbi:hypothetical protein D3C75_1278920 [compost metagenome]
MQTETRTPAEHVLDRDIALNGGEFNLVLVGLAQPLFADKRQYIENDLQTVHFKFVFIER